MDIKLTFDDATQVPRIQELLDAQNATRANAGDLAFDFQAFVQSEIEDHFEIKPEQVKQQKVRDISAKIATADSAKLEQIAAAVDAIVPSIAEPAKP